MKSVKGAKAPACKTEGLACGAVTTPPSQGDCCPDLICGTQGCTTSTPA